MSFFKRLFGLGERQAGASGSWETSAEALAEAEEHEGYRIVAHPVKEGGQYRLAGTISKEIDGELKEHQLIRADLFTSLDEAKSFTVTKAKQVIREQGDRMFG